MFALGVCFAAPAAGQVAAKADDIDRAAGAGWSGTLTYRDYTSEQRTVISAALQLTRVAPAANGDARWEWRVLYPKEPQENSADTVVLSANGRRFRGAEVTEREQSPDGSVMLVTEADGRDNDRPARLRMVYRFSARAASVQKFVRYEGGQYFERNLYAWTREHTGSR